VQDSATPDPAALKQICAFPTLTRAQEPSDQFFIVRIVPKRSRLSSAVTSVRSMS